MSSETSEDENLNFLKEAQDTQFLNDSMFTGKFENPTPNKLQNIPKSLRNSTDDYEHQHHHNSFKVTPEFRKHIAKHLSSFLEGELEEISDKHPPQTLPKKKRLNGGIKLFTDSKKFLRLDDKYEEVKINNSRLHKIPRPTKIEIVVDLKEVIVQSEDILSQKETKYWSNRTKSKVFKYKKNTEGTLELIEPVFQ